MKNRSRIVLGLGNPNATSGSPSRRAASPSDHLPFNVDRVRVAVGVTGTRSR